MTMKNDKAWIGDLLGGPLMSRESRIIAELMLTAPDEQTWQEQIVGHNILQASSANTAKRYATTIKVRLNTLDKAAWSLIAEGSERERQQLLFVALVLHSPVVKDFLAEVVNDLRRQFKETPRRRNLQSVFLLPETQATLQRLGQQELVSILEGQR